MPRTANDAASSARSQPASNCVSRMPAASGPMIVAMDSCALASELAASRPSAPPTSASSEYSPALPQVPRSDDAASRSTYVDGLSAWASDRVAIAARLPDRRKQCARTRTVGDRRRRNLPSVMPPMTPGSVYAATARPHVDAGVAGWRDRQREPRDGYDAHPVAQRRDGQAGEQAARSGVPQQTAISG